MVRTMKGSVRRSPLLHVTTARDGMTATLVEKGMALLRFLSSRSYVSHNISIAMGTDDGRILCGNGQWMIKSLA